MTAIRRLRGAGRGALAVGVSRHPTVIAGLFALLLAGCATPEPPPSPPAAPSPPPVVVPVEPPPPAPEPAPAEPPAPEPAPPPPAAAPEPPPPAPPPVNEEEQQALALLNDLHRLASASSDDLKREMASASQAVARGRNDVARVRLAWMISLTGAGPDDDARALALLEQVMGKSAAASPTKQLAALLHTQIGIRVRDVREEQKKTEAVQQKLDALKALERSLTGRERRPSGNSTKPK